jgi:hypothetical protein
VCTYYGASFLAGGELKARHPPSLIQHRSYPLTSEFLRSMYVYTHPAIHLPNTPEPPRGTETDAPTTRVCGITNPAPYWTMPPASPATAADAIAAASASLAATFLLLALAPVSFTSSRRLFNSSLSTACSCLWSNTTRAAPHTRAEGV